MRIEAGQHAVDRMLDQFLVRDRIDVVAADALDHIAKQSEQPVGIGLVPVLGERGFDAEGEHDMPCDQAHGRDDCHTGDEGGAEQ